MKKLAPFLLALLLPATSLAQENRPLIVGAPMGETEAIQNFEALAQTRWIPDFELTTLSANRTEWMVSPIDGTIAEIFAALSGAPLSVGAVISVSVSRYLGSAFLAGQLTLAGRLENTLGGRDLARAGARVFKGDSITVNFDGQGTGGTGAKIIVTIRVTD